MKCIKRLRINLVAAFLLNCIVGSASSEGLFGSGTPINVDKGAKESTKATATTDVSDLWWNPTESGWGMQLVQNNNFVFATIFVYGTDAKPTWYTAQLNNSGGFTWSGPLYATTGPWFGSFFDPNAVLVRQVGNLTFTATDIANGTLTYSVDGTVVTKSITRETLVNENMGGDYSLIVTRNKVCIPAVGSGTSTIPADFAITHLGNSVSGLSGGCTFTGTYSQNGKLGLASGTYSCPSGEVGEFTMSEIIVTETGLMLRMAETSNFCSSITVEAAGIRQ